MELEIIKWLGYLISAIIGGFVKVLWSSQERMREDFTRLERDMPQIYARRDDFKEDISDLRQGFKDAVAPILIKLDRLEDKHDKAVTEIHEKIERLQGVGRQ